MYSLCQHKTNMVWWPHCHLIICANCLSYKKGPVFRVTSLKMLSALSVWTFFSFVLKRPPPFKFTYLCIVFLPLCIVKLISHIFKIFRPFIEFHANETKNAGKHVTLLCHFYIERTCSEKIPVKSFICREIINIIIFCWYVKSFNDVISVHFF